MAGELVVFMIFVTFFSAVLALWDRLAPILRDRKNLRLFKRQYGAAKAKLDSVDLAVVDLQRSIDELKVIQKKIQRRDEAIE